jgi:hypothetical protein
VDGARSARVEHRHHASVGVLGDAAVEHGAAAEVGEVDADPRRRTCGGKNS